MTTETKSSKVRAKLTDGYVETLSDFPDSPMVVWDTHVRQLRVTVGKHRTTFSYFQQHRIHGRRSATVQVLGHWPAMNVDDARKEAQKIAGRNAAGRIAPGKRKAVKFAEAFTEYLSHLEIKAINKGKPP